MRIHVLLLAISVSACGSPLTQTTVSEKTKTAPTIQDALDKTNQNVFVENRGQWGDDSFRYVSSPDAESRIAASNNGWRVVMTDSEAKNDVEDGVAMHGVMLKFTPQFGSTVSLNPQQQAQGVHNYFLGDDKQRWQTNVPLYAAVQYDFDSRASLTLEPMSHGVRYILDARPGMQLSDVTFKVEGANSMNVAPDGSLEIKTAVGTIRQSPPSDAQWRYNVTSPTTYNFTPTGNNLPLTGIPTRLIYSTLFGGGDIDEVHAVSRHRPDIITTCGMTAETLMGLQRFPTTPGAFQGKHIPWTTASGLNNWPVTHHLGRAMDGFITQVLVDNGSSNIATSGYGLVFSTFLGSNANDYLEGVHVDDNGLITVGGYIEHNPFVTTPLNNYPLTADAVQSVMHVTPGYLPQLFAYREGILTQIDPTKTGIQQLAFSSYFGGTYQDDIRQVYGQGRGKITFAMLTSSHDLPGLNSKSFDATLGSTGQPQFLPGTYNGITVEFDAYIAQIDTSLANPANDSYSNPPPSSAIQWATYLGGGYPPSWGGTFDMINDMIVEGNMITVAGRTDAPNFPVSNPTIQGTLASQNPINWDGFVTRLDVGANPMKVVFSTFLGGGHFDIVEKMKIDPRTGYIYVVGNTESGHIWGYTQGCQCYPPSVPYPTTANAFDRFLNNFDQTGFIPSCSGNLNPFFDGIVSIIDPDPVNPHLVASTFYGGWDDDLAADIDINQLGHVTITGWTHSFDLGVTDAAFHQGGPTLVDWCSWHQIGNAADVFSGIL